MPHVQTIFFLNCWWYSK